MAILQRYMQWNDVSQNMYTGMICSTCSWISTHIIHIFLARYLYVSGIKTLQFPWCYPRTIEFIAWNFGPINRWHHKIMRSDCKIRSFTAFLLWIANLWGMVLEKIIIQNCYAETVLWRLVQMCAFSFEQIWNFFWIHSW